MREKTMTYMSIAVLLLGVILIPAFVQPAEKPRRGGRLVLGMIREISTLNPFLRTASTDQAVRSLVYETLLDFDKNGTLVPALAQTWTVSRDGKTYTFKLRRGVKFHNGKELTAEDVVWSAQYAINRQNAATGVTYLKAVKEVAAKDKLTVQFVLKEAEAVFLSNLATLRPFPIVAKDSVPAATENLPSFPPGTGPFVFKEWNKEKELVLTCSKHYWQLGLPYLDEISIKPIGDPQARFAALQSRDVDMIERSPYDLVSKIIKGDFPDLRATAGKYAGLRRMVFNVTAPPFDNIKLRQAVLYALDKKKYIADAFFDLGEPVNQRAFKGNPWYIELPATQPDAGKVKALLQEAGVGADFSIELLTPAGQGVEDSDRIIQEQLVNAGINAKQTIVEWNAYRKRQRSGEYMFNIRGGTAGGDPGETYPEDFLCNKDEVKANNRTRNFGGYCNKEVDRLLEEAGKVTDRNKRYELYSKAIRTIYDDVAEIPLASVPRYFTYRKEIRGFETDFEARINMTTAGISRIWIESPQTKTSR
jgi:peptide/nickel transport system substrate-binding protein